LPALSGLLKDPDTKVRAAAVSALGALGGVSAAAVPALAAALADDRDTGVRVAILRALDAIAPGSPAVLIAHVAALRDPETSVRAAAADFPSVPADALMVAALVAHLGDPAEDVRVKVASSLSELLFESPDAVPALFKAMHDQTQREAVLRGLGKKLDRRPTAAEVGRVRPLVLTALFPAIKDALAGTDKPIRLIVYRVLGGIALLPRNRPDANLRAAAEQALTLYLEGLNDGDASIREEVLGHVGSITIRSPEISQSLNTFLERSDLGEGERERATLDLKELSARSQGSDQSAGGSIRGRFGRPPG
jgi:HEAT repeats/HEAT repeat associated with sister chromatid cohesion